MMPQFRSIQPILLLFFIGTHLLAQSPVPIDRTTTSSGLVGDYQTVASGAWNRDSTWARLTPGGWVSPALPPDSGAGTITVRSGHTVTITTSVVYDQMTVESGGRVIVAANVAHTLSDGPGNDLTICGTWLNQGGTWTIIGGARWVVPDSGTFIHQSSSGISTPLSKSVLSRGSNFVFRGGPSVVPATSFSGRTYGNLALDSSGGPWSCTATGSSPLVVMGNLSVGPGVKWITGGFSGNISVQGATTLGGEWSGNGAGNLGTHSFVGRLEIMTTGKYQLGTTGPTQGAIVLQNDLENDGVLSLPQNRQVVFGGQRSQTIGGSSATLFSNGFTLINPAGILLGCPITVDGSLVLTVGNVSTGQHMLTLGSRGVLVEDGISAVMGTIRSTRSLSRGVIECFGNIGLEITALANDPGPTEVTRVTGAHMELNNGQSILRYFEVLPSVNLNLDATLKFHYKDSDLGALSEAYLSLFKSANGGAVWLRAGGVADPATNSVCLDGVDSFSRWTLGEFFPEPSLSRISPSLGSTGNQVDVLVEGSGFVAEGIGLVFSGAGIMVDSLHWTSATELRAHIRIMGDASIGVRDVTISTRGGTATLRDCFRVERPPNPAPLLARVRPSAGTDAQILTVMLEGSGFVDGVTTISFGDSIDVLSLVGNATSLTALISIAEGAGLGPRNVTAVNPAPGGGSSVLQNAFSVVNPVPTLTLAKPDAGVLGESVVVFLTGSDFVPGGSSVSFGEGITADSIDVIDRTRIRVRISISVGTRCGPREIVVTNSAPGGGSATLVDGFCVTNPAPKISSIAPSVCFRGRSTLLTITGEDFIPGTSSVSLSTGIRVDSIHIVNSTKIVIAIAIAREFSIDFIPITVKNPWPGGGSSSLARRLEVHNPPPVITGIFPDWGVLGQSMEILVTGTDFFDLVSSMTLGNAITVNSMSCDSSGTSLRATVTIAESASVGARNVVLRNCGPGGGEAVLERAFSIGYPAPTLVSISPDAAFKGQGLNVELTGGNFVPGETKVAFGIGVSVNSIEFVSRKRLIANIAVSSNAVVGARAVSATNPQPGGGSAELPHVFNVAYRAPSITRITPASGVKGGRLLIVIEGAEFHCGATSVEFGAGIMVDSVVVRSQSAMDAYVSVAPDALSGNRDVRVLNSLPGGGCGTLQAAFMVRNPPPEIVSVCPSQAESGRLLSVVIKGEMFVIGATSVSFGAGVTVREIVVRSQTELQATIEIEASAMTGPRTIAVTNEGPYGGTTDLEDGFLITSATLTSIDNHSAAAPDRYVLYQAFPNPFNLSTKIRIGLPERSVMKIEVYNVLGNLIAVLINGEHSRGYHEFDWQAAGVSSGVYVLRFTARSAESDKRYVGSLRLALIK